MFDFDGRHVRFSVFLMMLKKEGGGGGIGDKNTLTVPPGTGHSCEGVSVYARHPQQIVDFNARNLHTPSPTHFYKCKSILVTDYYSQ